ncbi:MAG: hypothetical protein KBG02_10160 [Haliscomenobacter sp.]|nr:hypothetical protein [Haliscomenobacter sp.]MBP9077211.1 hypothetical protein [Haliscomenobacter sp.]
MLDAQLFNLQRKVERYREVKHNTLHYREQWKASFRDMIFQNLESLCQAVGLEAKVEVRSEMENLEAVVLTLGDVKSGLYQVLGSDLQRDLIKHNGSLIYQQLFNGKVIVLVNYPFIENYGEPRPPKTIAIYRPEELQPPFFIRHVEEMLQEVTTWEDYDDDEPTKRIGFKFNFGQKSEPGIALEAEDQ